MAAIAASSSPSSSRRSPAAAVAATSRAPTCSQTPASSMSRRATLPTDRSSSFLVRKPRRDATRLDVNVDCVRDTLAQREHLLSLSLSCLCALARNRPLLVGHVRRGEHLSAMGWQACVARHDMHRLRQGTSLSPRAPHPISCPRSASLSLICSFAWLTCTCASQGVGYLPWHQYVHRAPRRLALVPSLTRTALSLSATDKSSKPKSKVGSSDSAPSLSAAAESLYGADIADAAARHDQLAKVRDAPEAPMALFTHLSLSLSCPHSACRHQQQPSQCTMARSDDGSTTSCSTRKMASAILKAFECVR